MWELFSPRLDQRLQFFLNAIEDISVFACGLKAKGAIDGEIACRKNIEHLFVDHQRKR